MSINSLLWSLQCHFLVGVGIALGVGYATLSPISLRATAAVSAPAALHDPSATTCPVERVAFQQASLTEIDDIRAQAQRVADFAGEQTRFLATIR